MKTSSKNLLRRALSLLVLCAMALTLLPAVALAAESGGVTYYVALSGHGGASGLSEADPFPGLDAVPWDSLLPGDSVLLKKGDTFPGSIRLVDVHGEAGSPITLGSYGSGNAPIVDARGQGIWLRETGTTATVGKYVSSGILLYDCSYITVSDIAVNNCPDALKTSFVDADNTSHADEKLFYSGVAVAADGSAAAEGITLRNITVRGDSDVTTVITETSSAVTQTGVNKAATRLSPRAFTNASGTYYVSSLNGSDANDGSSPDQAFYSLHRINELDLQPGAKVYLERGSVFENQYLHVQGGGSAGSPIIIDAYGDTSAPKPLINTNGNGVWYQNFRKNLDNSNHVRQGYVSSAINLYDVEYIEVKNLALTNFGHYGETTTTFAERYGFRENEVDGGTVPGETGYSASAAIGSYTWGGKMSRTGVSGVAQNKGTVDHVYLQNLDIERVYGNVYFKHMNNGGIYFTVSLPLNEAETGIARFNDLRIEGNYLKRVSRWGIAAAYTGAYCQHFANKAAISDEICQTYGSSNVYIGHNYLEEVGGDPITTMYDFKPLVEGNVALRGAREIIADVYMNGSAPNGNKGNVAAGIWPWKCKTAVFQYNECYDMLHGGSGNGNNDAQAWDVDWGDSTIYQYNYSSGNTGGCIMFCYGEAYNPSFRYNISYKDAIPGANVGVFDMSENPNGQIVNNTFIVAENTNIQRSDHKGRAYVENNIFYNLGQPYAPNWDTQNRISYNNNIYVGFSDDPGDDAKAITADKDELFADTAFSDAPTGPVDTTKSGAGTVNGMRTWTHDWANDFAMFELKEGADKAVNKGVAHSYTGLTQDSSFGVAQVPIDTDFFGNPLDSVHDIGAHDTLTPGGETYSSDNELKSSLYELRNTTELQVPFTAQNPLTVADFKTGLTVAEDAEISVKNGAAEVDDDDPVAENMTVQIIAADGTESGTVYTIKNKNDYNHKTDFVGNQQGNVWFHQTRSAATGELGSLTSFAGGDNGWWTGGQNICAEYNGAADAAPGANGTKQYDGTGFVFRAPVAGKVTVSFPEQPKFRYPAKAFNNSYNTYLVVYVNGQQVTGQKTQVPRPASASAAAVAANIPAFDVTLARGDTLEILVLNEGEFTSAHESNGADVLFNVAVSYKDEALTEPPADTRKPTTPTVLKISSLSHDSAAATWLPSTDNVAVDHYGLILTNSGTTVRLPDASGTSVTLSDLSESTTYTLSVTAFDPTGNESAPAEITFTTPAAPDVEAPQKPSAATVSAVTKSKSATLSWPAFTDNVAVDRYEVTVNGKTPVTVQNVTKIAVSDLNPSTNYTVSVVAYDAAGNASDALTGSFTTQGPDTEKPTAPGDARVLNVTQTSAVLRWLPSTDNETVAGYEVKVEKTGETGTFEAVGNVITFALTGLDGFTDYTAAIVALDDSGNRSAEATVTFKTLGSSACELLSSLFEVRNGVLQIPYTEQNPLTVEELISGLEISENAVAQVVDASGSLVTGSVDATMTVKIVAQDPSFSTTLPLAQKNAYNNYNDWVTVGNAHQQGNVWFAQYKKTGGYTNWEASRWNSGGWYSDDGNGYASAQADGACDAVTKADSKIYFGSGFTFRAPAEGMVQISFPTQPIFKNASCTSNTFTTYLVIYKNGVEVADHKHELPKSASQSATIPNFNLALTQGDTVEFMVLNEGGTSTGGQGGVRFTPAVTYLDQPYVPDPTAVTLDDDTAVTLYTNNTAQFPGSVTRAATVEPAEADQTVTWSSTNPAVATVDAQTGEVTAVADGDIRIVAAATTSSGQRITDSYVVHVVTRMESITIKNGAQTVTDAEPIKLYVNKDDPNHTVTLTAETTPATVTHPALEWTRVSGIEDAAAITDSDANNTTITITATEDILNVGELRAQVASVEHPEVATPFVIHVVRRLENDIHITGDAQVGGTLAVSTVDLEMTTEGKSALTYQWAVDGEDIPGATDRSYAVTEADVGKVISVTATADPATFYEGARTAQTAAIAKGEGPAAPELTVVNCTSGDNGQITGLDAAVTYEYKLADAADDAWTEVTTGQTAIQDLPAGNYEVRVKESDAYQVGEAATVTVMAADANAFAITAEKVEGGAVKVVPTQAEEGDQVTVTLTPQAGYELVADSLKVTYEDDEGNEQTVTVTNGKFTMPAAAVTVTAEFRKLKFTITHALAHSTCSLAGEHTHEVEYGDAPTIIFTADEGYLMPINAPVITTADGPFYAFTYTRDTDDPDQATLVFTDGIKENLTITGTAEEIVYSVTYNLKGGLPAPAAQNAPTSVTYKAAFSATLRPSADNRYQLPDNIVITMGGSPFEDYDYNKTTGVITVAAGVITGDLLIAASGVDTDVDAVPVEHITITGGASVTVGGKLNLSVIIDPADATLQDVVWSSDNTDVATVDQNGVVTGVSKGTAVITAIALDSGTVSDTQIITVTEKVQSTSSSGGSAAPAEPTTQTRADGAEVTTVINPNGSVTETVTQPDGSAAAKTTARNGAVTIVVTDANGEEVASVDLPAKIPAPAEAFVDLSVTPWAEEAINNMAGLKLVNGIGGQKYDPATPMTRGSLAIILQRLSNGKTDYRSTFVDIEAGKYYTEGVTWAAKVGVVKGITDEIFAPNQIITREQLAVMLARYAKLIGMETTSDAKALDAFVDGASTGSWAVDGVAWCVENGILKGKGQNDLDPTADVTRAEVAVMLDRFIALAK